MKRLINNTKTFSITKRFKMKRLYCVICGKYRKCEKLKISCLLEKCLSCLLLFPVSTGFKEKESVEILKNSWFKWKYIITLKIWAKNLD